MVSACLHQETSIFGRLGVGTLGIFLVRFQLNHPKAAGEIPLVNPEECCTSYIAIFQILLIKMEMHMITGFKGFMRIPLYNI